MPRDHPQPEEPQVAGNPGMGCIIIACAFAMFTGIATYGIWAGLKQDRDIAKFTDESPLGLPSEPGTTGEWTTLKERMTAFESAALETKEASRLELSVRDLNLIIANSTLMLESREMAWFDGLEENGIRARISMPINRIAFWKDPRYLNGTALITIESSPSQLFLRMKEVKVPGKIVQQGFVERLAQSDLLGPYRGEDAPLEPVINAITSVRVEGDRIVIIADPSKKVPTGKK